MNFKNLRSQELILNKYIILARILAWEGKSSIFNVTCSLPASEIKSMVQSGIVVIANVDKGHHFVLVTGFDHQDVNFYINDPYFNVTYYEYNTIVGYRVFYMG